MSAFDLLLFDFDGVLFETNRAKSRAFADALAEYPADKVHEFVAYHHANGGISRYIKLRYFFEEMLKMPNSEAEQAAAAERFGVLCNEYQANSPMLPGAKAFLFAAHAAGIPLMILSGGRSDEIKLLLVREALGHCFVDVLGNEQSKLEHAATRITPNYAKVCFFGDSQYDMQTAQTNGYQFCFISAVTDWPEGASIAASHGHSVAADFCDASVTALIASAAH